MGFEKNHVKRGISKWKNVDGLDILVVERGFAQTRSRARALVLAGKVLVNNSVESKAGAQVATEAKITLVEPDHPYVGRGGIKLHACTGFI